MADEVDAPREENVSRFGLFALAKRELPGFCCC
jgi:hypothetical protein